MQVQIDNIIYNFINQSSDHLQDSENLGLAHLIIPGPMCKRFAKEVGHQTPEGKPLIAHYDSHDMQDISLGSDHECYNSDTQIVLMSYLFGKRRKYELDYYGLDPFWLFHDSFHAKNDVWGGEVQGIWSGLEYERLLQGAEFAKSKGVLMLPETIAKLSEAWVSRWKWNQIGSIHPFKERDFYKFLSEEDIDQLDFYLDCGTFNTRN